MLPKDDLKGSSAPATSEGVAMPQSTSVASGSQQDPHARLGIVEHAVLGVGWLACLALAWLPLLLVVVLLGLLLVSTAASYSLLRVGAFAATDRRFLRWCVFGLVTACVVLAGAFLRRVMRPQGSHERVLGPGGRVLRVILRRPSEQQQGWPSQIPDTPSLLAFTLLLIGGHVWLSRRPSASAGTVALIVTNLVLLSIYWPAFVLWLGGRLAWALHRVARSGRYSAGFISALLLIGGLYVGVSWVRFVRWAQSEITTAMSRTDVEESVSDSAPGLAPRAFLFSLAEAFWPEQATDAGVRHLVAPLLARTTTVAPDELARLGWDGLAQYAQYGGFVSADEAAPPAFKLCIETLYPAQVSRVKRLPSFRQFRLDDDSEHDVLLGAVLEICENHALRKPYDNLVQVLERAAVNAAIDTKRRNQRIVISDENSGYFDRCPNPYDAPDHRLSIEQELARVKWSELRPVQKAIIIEKAVLELEDDEIAANHSPMTKGQVKDAYQNSIKKIRSKLVASCPADRW